jgi:hypothetical protein
MRYRRWPPSAPRSLTPLRDVLRNAFSKAHTVSQALPKLTTVMSFGKLITDSRRVWRTRCDVSGIGHAVASPRCAPHAEPYRRRCTPWRWWRTSLRTAPSGPTRSSARRRGLGSRLIPAPRSPVPRTKNAVHPSPSPPCAPSSAPGPPPQSAAGAPTPGARGAQCSRASPDIREARETRRVRLVLGEGRGVSD